MPRAWATSASSRVSPTWPLSAPRSRSAGVKPRPSSVTTSRVVARLGSRDLDPHGLRLAVRLRVADRLARHAVDERVVLAARSGGLVDRQLRRDARGRQWAEQVAQRHLQAGRLEVGRIDLHEQRPQVADPLAERGGGVVQRFRLGVLAAALGPLGQRREPERDARQVLHDAVVQVGGDAAALLRRGLDGARQQVLALAVPALQPPRHRPRERQLEEEQHDHAAEQRRGQRPEQPLGAGADRAEALVDLEQHLRAVRRADRGVRLEQLALRPLVAVLRVAEIADLRVRAARLEQLQLVLAEREPLADQRRFVGVQDRAVLRPQLHAHERAGDDLAEDEVVQRLDRRRLAAQDAVAQAGRLDQPCLRLNTVAGVALGLVDRDLSQREEPADDDDRDRREAGEHEARQRRGETWGLAGHAVNDVARGGGSAMRPRSHCGPDRAAPRMCAMLINSRNISLALTLAAVALTPAAALADHGADDGGGAMTASARRRASPATAPARRPPS